MRNFTSTFACALITCSLAMARAQVTQPAQSEDLTGDLYLTAVDMTKSQIAKVKLDLKAHPSSAKDRLILAYHFADPNNAAITTGYCQWLIKRYPEAHIYSQPPFDMPDAAQTALWEAQIKANPTNVGILKNAANAFTINQQTKSEAIYRSLITIQPHAARWPLELARLYGMNADTPFTGRATSHKAAEMSLRYARAALNLAHSHYRKIDATTLAMQACYNVGNFASAKAYASSVIALLPSSDPEGDIDARYSSRMMRGLVALHNKDVKLAVHYLLLSGRISGSAVLDSFGPSMQLADQLLKAGERKAVIKFLDECKVFWQNGPNLDNWKKQIAAGKQPDFEAW
jgi:tetratricopeptide (TPR) repeat protein